MKRGIKYTIIAIVVIFVVAIPGLVWFLNQAMPIGTGFVAKYICSSTFISRRDPGMVFEQDVSPVNPLAAVIQYRIDKENRRVTADAYGLFRRKAIFREGIGCTLVVDSTEAQLRRQQLLPPDFSAARPSRPENRLWPMGRKGPVDPQRLSIDVAQLNHAIDNAFAEKSERNLKKTYAVVVVYKGQLVAERYAPGFDKDMPLLGWSMAKSVTNALVGILVQAGRMDILMPAAVPEWQAPEDPRREITLDQMLRMSSGLAFEEEYGPLADATDMLYGSADFAAFAAQKPLAGPPDSLWSYSSGTTNIISRIVRQMAAGDHPHYYTFFHEKLFDKIGMFSAVFEPDASGTFVGSSYLFATPRDWARFGLLYLQDGIWQGERILPEGWVNYSATPTGEAPNGQYGAHFWLNAGEPGNPAGRRWPDAPTDAFAAHGFQEQRVIIIPSRDLVLVRFGASTDRSAWDSNLFIKDVLAVLP